MPSPSKLGLALLLASGAFAAPNPNLGSSTNISITVGNNTFNFNNNLTIDTSKWLDAKKLLRVTTTQRRAVIRAMSLNRSVQYFGEYHLSTAGIPNIGARFFLRNEDSTSAFGLRAGLLQLAEVNPDQNIDLAKSSNVIKFAGSTQYWSPINETDVPNTNNVTVKKLSTTFTNTTSPGKPNVTVTIDAFLASEKVTIDGVTYIPRSLKYSLLIENFPYQYANSQLAIVKGVMFRSVDLDRFSFNKDGSVAIAGAKGHFNWTSSIKYDGQNSQIDVDTSVYTDTSLPVTAIVQDDISKVDASEASKFVVFRTKAGNYSRIDWDPEVAVDEEKVVSGASTVAASFGVSMMVLFSTLFVHLF